METQPMHKTLRPNPDKLREQIEAQEHWVIREPPILRRIALCTVQDLQHPAQPASEFICDREQLLSLGRRPRFIVRRVVRARWVVKTTTGILRSGYWEKLHMAQAERDGLNFHYAKYLLTKGTAAAS